MSTLSKVSTLTTLECGSCHIPFAMPTSMHEAAVRTGSLASARRRAEWAETARQAARDQAETAEYRRRAEKAAKTRLKNRIAAGVCPCCTRAFQNLQRHMAGQHPDFVKGPES